MEADDFLKMLFEAWTDTWDDDLLTVEEFGDSLLSATTKTTPKDEKLIDNIFFANMAKRLKKRKVDVAGWRVGRFSRFRKDKKKTWSDIAEWMSACQY